METEKQSSPSRIFEHFRSLVMEHGFERLTVAEVCTHAGVSRKTFYSYFKDKNDIVEQIVRSSITKPFQELRRLYINHQLDTSIVMEWLYQQFYEDRPFYERISSYTGQNSFQDFLLKETSIMLKGIIDRFDLSDVEKEYMEYFYATSHIILLIKWIRDGMIVPPQTMASYYEKWTIPIWKEFYKKYQG